MFLEVKDAPGVIVRRARHDIYILSHAHKHAFLMYKYSQSDFIWHILDPNKSSDKSLI